MENELKICVELLKLFHISESVSPDEIEHLKIHRSQIYVLGPVYAFDYQKNHYYVVDDYSLGDDLEDVKNILLDINHLLKGNIVRNSSDQSDGAIYAEGFDGTEYYLWEAPLGLS